MNNPITLTQAVEGYLIAAAASGLSENTRKEYAYYFRRLREYFERTADPDRDPPFDRITIAHLQAFLNDYTGISQKTRCNVHIALSSLWRWSVGAQLVPRNIVRDIRMNKPEQRAIHPFTRDDVKDMLNAVDRSKPYARPGKRECTHSLRQALRNKALIYLLLDTGLRAGEVADLPVRYLELKNLRVKVYGKGAKERIVPFSAQTGQVIWRYLASRGQLRPDDPAFATGTGRAMGRDDMRHIIADIGDRAGIPNAHPHRFRHTFAINFLRNGGNVYTLKEILGHSTLTMCQRYLELADADIENNYRPASPVRNWNL